MNTTEAAVAEAGTAVEAARKALRKTNTPDNLTFLNQAIAKLHVAEREANKARAAANTQGPYSINV